ncbi:hypothetical protein LPUS_02207 [Lasallia pustulata]|uniref:Glycosyltransferase family 31 protein n=1 Tax=Lasallia pustulata TaxID=136370 RepID=A0A1W5CSA9_9LECA|nr:hypothetical protein LPUS_02207 [Lasallia pustulata]
MSLYSRRTLISVVVALALITLIASFPRSVPDTFHFSPESPSKPLPSSPVSNSIYESIVLDSPDKQPTTPPSEPSPIQASSTATATPTPTPAPTYGSTSPDRRCEAFPDQGDILLVVKTGATESYDKLPTQLLTNLQCADDFLIFSDLEQHIGKYHIHDVLKQVNNDTKASDHFELYRAQQEYQKAHQDIHALEDDLSGSLHEHGWTLDKYKFLHMLIDTYHMREDKKWYVFLETDTYLVWSNFLQWVDKLDASKSLYIGSPAALGSQIFAHGGSGFMLSGAAMHDFIGRNPEMKMLDEFDATVKDSCCGDAHLAKFLEEKSGIKTTGAWPMINGEKPITLPFGPTHWCSPVMTMHHLTPEEVSTFWQYEQQRPKIDELLLFEEIFEFFVEPNLKPEREDWDNLSKDQVIESPKPTDDDQPDPEWEEKPMAEKNAFRSFEDCGAFCASQPDCFQYVHHGSSCGISKSFKLGQKQPEKNGEKWRSASNMTRIREFTESHRPCKNVDWINI